MKANSWLQEPVIGVNGLPPEYMYMMQNIGWQSVWEGFTPHDAAWTEGTVMSSQNGWANIKALGADIPGKLWSGEYWRGCELGFLVLNPYMFANNSVKPATIALGSTPKQKSVIRPFVENLFKAPDAEGVIWMQSHIAQFLADRLQIPWPPC